MESSIMSDQSIMLHSRAVSTKLVVCKDRDWDSFAQNKKKTVL